MNVLKSLILLIALSTITHLNVAMSPDLAAKSFVYNKITTLEKYHMFTHGTVHGNTIFDIVFPLIEQKKTAKEIFDYLVKTSPVFMYKGKQESILEQQAALVGNITGFVDVLKNEYELFCYLTPAILAIHNQEPEIKEEEEESPEWKPAPPKFLSITDKQIKWAQEELVVELDFYIMEFGKVNEFVLKPTEHKFELWLQGRDAWWIQETFEKWVTKSLNLTTNKRKALSRTQFSTDGIIFFIATYIPKMILIKNPARTKVSWDILKEMFHGFNIYGDKNLFNFAGDFKTRQSMSFLVKMINENLTKMIKNNQNIGKATLEAPKKMNKKQSSIGLQTVTKTLGFQCKG